MLTRFWMQISQLRRADRLLATELDENRRPGRVGALAAAGGLSFAPGRLSVEIAHADRFTAVASQWRDLVGRAAEPNVFQEPSYVRAAATAAEGRPLTLLAWQDQAQPTARLAGAWTLRVAAPPSGIPVRVLRAPLVPDYGFLSTPVIDRDLADEVLTALLNAVASDPALPKTLLLQRLGSDGPVMAALARVLGQRNSASLILHQARRAKLSTAGGVNTFQNALSSSTRKKLRQHRRRLAQTGDVTTIAHAGPVDGARAFERFLQLEAASWKGKAGTAILCRDGDAAFARDAFRQMAADGCAWVEALHVGDRIVSAQVLMRSGPAAFTWKIAHDESFADFSPGILLVEDYSAKLLADQSLAFADSCSFDEQGFMADLWKERRSVVDVCFPAVAGGSLSFTAVASAERLYSRVREQAKTAKQTLDGMRLNVARLLRRGRQD